MSSLRSAQEIQGRQVFFFLLAGNGQTILSSEMYDSNAGAHAGIESVKKNAADDARYVGLDGKDGSLYFTLRAGNNQVIGQSQMYASATARDNGTESCKANGPGTTTSNLNT